MRSSNYSPLAGSRSAGCEEPEGDQYLARMKYVLPIGAMLLSGFLTLMMVVFTLAGMANARPEQLRTLELWVGGFILVYVGSLVASIVLLRKGRVGNAILVALAPTMVMCLLVLVVGM